MKLGTYLKLVDLTPERFAELIGVDAVSVRRYLAGSRRPSWEVMPEIVRVTEGAVGPSDFLEAPKKRGRRMRQVA